MITDADIKKMKEVFVTKEDLLTIEQTLDKKFNEKFDEKIKPIHRKLNKLQKDLDTVIRVFDSQIVDLDKRVDKIERTVFMSV